MEKKRNAVLFPSVDKPWQKFYSEEAVRAELPKKTIYEYLLDASKDHMDDIAIIYFNRKITYRSLFQSIDQAYRSFHALGVKPGEYVVICSVNTPEVFAAFYALNRIGAVACMVDPRTNTSRIEDFMKASNTRKAVVLENALPRMDKIYADGAVDNVIVVSVADSMDAATGVGYFLKTKGKKPAKQNAFLSWKQFLALRPYHECKDATYIKGAPAAVVFTGGTTGVPKAAVLSNDSLNAVTIEYKTNGMDYRREERFLNIMPPFIAYGIACGLNMPLAIGLTNVIVPAFDPEEFASLVMKYKPQHFIGVPMHFERLIKNKKLQKADLSFIKTAAAGGDAMNPASERQINAFFTSHNCKFEIIKGYGMTELGSAAVTTLFKVNKLGSVGIPLPLMNVSVRSSETGKELPCCEEGELYMSGPSQMIGYFGNEEEYRKLASVDADGTVWIKTGDIGYMDDEGFIFLRGRKKRMIIRPDGHNVWPSVIDDVICQHPLVESCATVGRPNELGTGGKIPTAFVVTVDRKPLTEAQIASLDAFCKEHLPERDCAMAYRSIDALPMTPIGKVDYLSLEKMD